jgi:hypothetical protein
MRDRGHYAKRDGGSY